jgi:hypothetical protein
MVWQLGECMSQYIFTLSRTNTFIQNYGMPTKTKNEHAEKHQASGCHAKPNQQYTSGHSINYDSQQ